METRDPHPSCLDVLSEEIHTFSLLIFAEALKGLEARVCLLQREATWQRETETGHGPSLADVNEP